ncbi:hypothetical protein JCM5296_007554 [Sporobolomyces johnsonii]
MAPQDTAAASDAEKVQLDLVEGDPSAGKHTIASSLHFGLVMLALLIRLPFHILLHYVFLRPWSPLVQLLGRPASVEVGVQAVRLIFGKVYLAPSRPVFAKREKDDWVELVEVNGTKGTWLAPPRTERKDDDLVLYFLHGGAFTFDTRGGCQPFYKLLAEELNLNRNIQFSVFCLDYQLAPEKIYPSQLIETLAGYHYLVNKLGIAEEKICLGGDSAGACLAAAFMLHLARPNPRIVVPQSLGPTPKRPGSALLLSPFIDLVSYAASRHDPVKLATDFVDDGVVFLGSLSYVGAAHPEGWHGGPRWNPFKWWGSLCDAPPKGIVEEGLSVEEAEKEGRGIRMLSSPYVNPNPNVVKDWTWYTEAFPAPLKTMITWGGMEIFSDDVELLVKALKEAGVAPVELCKPLGSHDFILFDLIVPGSSKVKTGGEESKSDYGVRKIADFLADQVKGKATEVEVQVTESAK